MTYEEYGALMDAATTTDQRKDITWRYYGECTHPEKEGMKSTIYFMDNGALTKEEVMGLVCQECRNKKDIFE